MNFNTNLSLYDLPPHLKAVMKKADVYLETMKKMGRTVDVIVMFPADFDALELFVKAILTNGPPATMDDMTYRNRKLKKLGMP